MFSMKTPQARALLLILANILSLALLAQPVIAQDEADDEEMTLEEVLVTGSHIRRSDYDTRAPIQIIGREEMAAQGASTIIDVAKNLTVNTGSFITQETGGLIGTAQFNVRGLGAGSTLTLINGRRAGKSATADGNGNQFFDVNQLPLMAIDRIDVQTDGASATYGSEAVGGVVNIFTRKGFEGLEFMARYEDSSNSAYSINTAMGTQSDRGKFNLYATYYHQSRNSRTDFSWLTDRIAEEVRFYSSNGGPGNYQFALLDPVTGEYLGGSGSERPDADCLAAGGVNTATSSRCRANFIDQVSIIPEEQRIQAFAEGDYDISDNVRAYMEVSFSNNEISRTQGTSLYDKGLANGRMLIPADHPFNFWVSDGEDGITYIDPTEWDNGIHTAVPLNIRGRPFGVEEFYGDNPFNQDLEFRLNYFRVLGGVEVALTDDWILDTSYVYNKAEWRQSTPYKYSSTNLNAALLDGSYNPFGTRIVDTTLVSPKDGVSVAGLSEDVFNDVTYTEINEAQSEQAVVDVIASGDAFYFHGRPVGMAFGFQYRDETYWSRQDQLTQSGLGGRNGESIADINGKQNVYAGFAEILFPASDTFEISAALRYEDFGGGIGSTTDPKLAARWDVTDSVALRASYGTAFQAPSVRQTGVSVSTSFVNDPFTVSPMGDLTCGGPTAQANTIIRTGGDDNLKPQTANNFNAGIILEPTDKLSISVDYWYYDYTDLIRADANPQSIVDADCADDGIANDPRVIRSASGQLSSINVSFINTGNVVTDGIDAHLSYSFDNGLTLGAQASYVNKFDITNSDGSVIDGAGSRNFSNPFSSVPQWRANATGSWNHDGHSVNAAIRYISSYDNDQVDRRGDIQDVESWTTVDLRYSYSFENIIGIPSQYTTVSLGMNNIFDEDPPSLGLNVRPGYDANVHDVRGRLIYAELLFGF